MKVDYSYITSESIEGLTGMDELEQRARIYDSIDRKIILRLIAEERANVSPDAPVWNDVRELLDTAISLLMNHTQHDYPEWLNEYEKLCKNYESLLPAPPDVKEG